jgi:MFS family permease
MLKKEVRDSFRDMLALMRGNFLVVTLGFSWVMSWMQIFNSYESVYIRSLGASAFIIGAYFGVNGLIRAVAGIPGGYLCDTYGRRKMIVVGNYLSAVIWILVALAPSWQFYLAAQFLLSLGTFWIIAENTILADSMTVEKRGLGFSLFWTATQLAGLASPYIGGLVFEIYNADGLRWVLVLIGAADCVKAVVYTKFLKETLVSNGRKDSLGLRSIIDSFTEMFKTLKWMPHALLGFCAMEALFGFAWSMVGPFFTLYALDVISLTPVEWGLLSTIEMGVNLCLRVPGGRLADRFNKRWLLLVHLAAEAPGFMVFIYSRSYLHLVLLWVAWSAIEALTDPSFDALLTDLTPKEQRGKVSSLLRIFGASFGVFGSIAGGYLYGLDPVLPFWVYAPLAVLATVVAFQVIHEPEEPAS